MTRFDADLHRLATQLAAMVAAPAATAIADDPVVVDLARRALRTCCVQMLNDLAPQGDDIEGEPSLADLALNPMGVVRAQLTADPLPLASPAARVELPVARAANEQWQRLGHAAEIVTHGWATADPASRPSGEQVWVRIADVAALAEAGSAIDRQLIDAAPRATAALRTCVELAVAAEHTRRFAMSGPLPRAEPLRLAPHRLTPVIIRTLADLPTALASLDTLVATASHLRPDMIAALANTHARTLDTLAGALTTASPPAHRAGRRRFADALTAHGQALGHIRVACRTLTSLDADDPRPAAQMREIRVAVRRLAERPRLLGDADAQKALLAGLRPALSFASAIAMAASGHIRSGRWLMPDDHDKLTWCKVGNEHPIHEAVGLAAAHARTFINQLPAPRSARAPYPSPHEILTPASLCEPYGRQRLAEASPGTHGRTI